MIKKCMTFLVPLLFLMMVVSCGPTKNEAIEYNDHIMTILNNLTVSHNQFLNQIDGHNIDSLKIVHKEFSEKASASLEEVKKIEDFNGSSDYKNAAVHYFSSLNDIAHHEGKQMVDIMSRDYESLTAQDFEEIEGLASKFDISYGKAYDKIIEAQAKFAAKWDFMIEKSKN